MIRLGLLGSTGKLGQAISAIAQAEFSAEIDVFRTPRRGEPLDSLLECDIVVDVTVAQASQAAALWALSRSESLPAWIVGTTGLSESALHSLATLSGRTPVLVASNFSLGMLLLQEILRSSQALLKKWGFSPTQIRETHHLHKRDQPSGTAISLSQILSSSASRPIEIVSVRKGEAIGLHEVLLSGQDETLTFTHDAHDRRIFARGALRLVSALHAHQKTPVNFGRILEPRDLLRP
jgi:4-hydroxy-tetrahydrodipicolinate reductase